MEYNQISLFGEVEKSNNKKNKTVVSASRRTDIPAFFYEWLQEVLKKGHVELANPLFQTKTYTVDLRPENVHSIVLWSKNFKHVLDAPMHLDNYNLYFQYTINNYSKALEPNVPEYKYTLKVLDGLLKKYNPNQFNIRFDPIIISIKAENNPTPQNPEKARLYAFENMCRDMSIFGINRITTSYLSLYNHVKKTIERENIGVIFLDEEKQVSFFESMVEIADKYGITLYSCASPIIERVNSINKGHCIDGQLLEQLFGGKVKKSKDRGQRDECGCSCSKDIGEYANGFKGMRCLHGCKYCYCPV